nr:monodehydroascorbate reductase [Tanacetum cinerariifolium]
MADVNVPSGQALIMTPTSLGPLQLPPPYPQLTSNNTLREALQITPVNNNQAFAAPPASEGLINFVNRLGYPKLVRNLSNAVTNDLFQPWRALLTIINLCLTGKTSGFERPRAPVLQNLWGIVKQAKIDYAERIWEKFFQSIHTFIEDKLNLSRHTTGKKRATLIVIPSICAKGTKREVFGMPIPGSLITVEIQEASYYREYMAKVAQHQRYLAGKTGSNLVSHALKPTKPARKPKSTVPKAPPRPAAGSNPDETSEGQAGPDPGDARAKVQSIPSLVVHVGSDPYPKVQENLKLTVEEQALLEDPASSSGTLSSLQHLSKDISFGDLFFSDRSSDADKNAETEVESMVNVLIQQAMSSISLMTSLIIDLTSRPESPKVHQQFKTTTTDTTTTTTTTTLPPQAQQQSTAEAMMVKRIALEKSMNRDHSEELAQDLAEARKKKKKSRESPKTSPGSPSHQPPPPPPPAGPSGASKALGASGSSHVPPSPPPPSSTNQESSSKGSAAPSSSKTDTSAEYQAWTTTDIRLRPSISLTLADLEMDEDMAPDEQAQLSDDEDIGSAHILTTGDIATFMDWFCKRRGITELKPQDLEGPAYEIIKVFHPDVIHLQYQMKECHKLLTDSVDDPILRHNVSKPLPLGGPPGQVTIQSHFFFNKDLEYLRYGSKGRRP